MYDKSFTICVSGTKHKTNQNKQQYFKDTCNHNGYNTSLKFTEIPPRSICETNTRVR